MKDLDQSFAQFKLPWYTVSEGVGLSENNQCLVAYNSYDTTSTSENSLIIEPNYYLIDLSVGSFPGEIDTTKCTRIQKSDEWGKLLAIHTIGDYFFVSCTNKTMRISPNLEIDNSKEGTLYRIFKYNGNLYGIDFNHLYVSYDNGLNWEALQAIAGDFVNINYRVIDGNLIGYFNSQIFHFDIDQNGILNVGELANDGISGNEITSISLLQDKIYITTLSGLFTRLKEDFLEYK